MKLKAFSIIFKRLSLKQVKCFWKGESPTLINNVDAIDVNYVA